MIHARHRRLFSSFGGRDGASCFVWQPAAARPTLRLSTRAPYPPADAWLTRGTWLDACRSVQLVRIAVCLALVACRPPGYGKGDDDDLPDVDAGTPADGAPADTPGATTCDRAFRLEGRGDASSVWLTGSFVAWGGDPANGAIELLRGADQVWTGSHTFAMGSHQYKFIVSGSEWITDPANPDQVDDGFGGKNSLYVCAP